jgi:hypothetical protein
VSWRHRVKLLLELAQERGGFCEPRFLAFVQDGVESPRELARRTNEKIGRWGAGSAAQELKGGLYLFGECARTQEDEIRVDQDPVPRA